MHWNPDKAGKLSRDPSPPKDQSQATKASRELSWLMRKVSCIFWSCLLSHALLLQLKAIEASFEYILHGSKTLIFSYFYRETVNRSMRSMCRELIMTLIFDTGNLCINIHTEVTENVLRYLQISRQVRL